MAAKKLKRLECDLQQLDVFENPKLSLEQYHTPPRFAAELIHAIEMEEGLSDKCVVDLGCGCGVLGLGCVSSGAAKVLGIDIDEEALAIATQNRDGVGLSSDELQFLHGDVRTLCREELPSAFRVADLVVSNPPFGIWGNDSNIDLVFVKKGLELSDVVYTVHKSCTRNFLKGKAKEMGACVDFILQNMDFPIPQTYGFHKFKEHTVIVDVAKFTKLK